MIIRFHNLGKIKETELDLKPLTVIIGPNNSNKTYIAYSIYGLWQKIGDLSNMEEFQLHSHSNGSFSISLELLRKAFSTYITKSVREFSSELENFYQDSSRQLFSQSKFEVSLSREEFMSGMEPLPKNMLSIFDSLGFRGNLENELLVMYPIDEVTNLEERESRTKTGVRDINRFRADLSLKIALSRLFFSRPYLLPAERNAFVITYKVLANRRLKLILDAQRRAFSSRDSNKRQLDLLREAGEVRYPQPIEDFLEFLFEVESETNPSSNSDDQSISRSRPRSRRSPRNGLVKLAGNIEQNIQDGNKISFRATALGGQEIMVDVGNGMNIDLYNASSSIKQLAPLLLYLRYRASKGDLLIIDEPEMNLHPESQAKLIEVLAMLVNQGVYVLLTTHSPYLMSHLNNLVQTEEGTTVTKRRQANSLYLKDPMSLLQMSQISAYEMRDSQLHSLKDPEYGIRWDTLSDVSAELQQKFFNIHE